MIKSSTGYDVIVVGGGPVGLTFAASLTRFMDGVRVAVCDARAFELPRDGRASALAAGVTRVFETLGVWEGMREAAQPIERMRITDSGRGDISRPLFLSFEGDVVPGRPYAHMVPNVATIGALLKGMGGVDLIAPVSVTGYSAGPAGAEVSLADGRVLKAPLVVGADGARSALRDMAGIKTLEHDYKRSAIVTTIAHQFDHEGTAYEHFRPAGPFASLPLLGKRSSLVWTESHDEAIGYERMDRAGLAPVIEAVMGSTLGAVTVEDSVQVYPLRMRLARKFAGPRLALIGDAAHTVHPVAGQGMNLGLKDVAALAETLIDAMRLGQDHGGVDILDTYQRWRRFDTALMALGGDALVRLFSNDIAPLRIARDIGLGVVERLPPVKKALIRRAAAASRGEPRLLQGQAL